MVDRTDILTIDDVPSANQVQRLSLAALIEASDTLTAMIAALTGPSGLLAELQAINANTDDIEVKIDGTNVRIDNVDVNTDELEQILRQGLGLNSGTTETGVLGSSLYTSATFLTPGPGGTADTITFVGAPDLRTYFVPGSTIRVKAVGGNDGDYACIGVTADVLSFNTGVFPGSGATTTGAFSTVSAPSNISLVLQLLQGILEGVQVGIVSLDAKATADPATETTLATLATEATVATLATEATVATLATEATAATLATEATAATLATEATVGTLAVESGGNLDTIAGDTTSLVGATTTDGGATPARVLAVGVEVAGNLNAVGDVNPLPISGSVSVSSSALPAGAATEATLGSVLTEATFAAEDFAQESGGNLATIAGAVKNIGDTSTGTDPVVLVGILDDNEDIQTFRQHPDGGAITAPLATVSDGDAFPSLGNTHLGMAGVVDASGNASFINKSANGIEVDVTATVAPALPTVVVSSTQTTSLTPNTPTNPFTGAPKSTVTLFAAASNSVYVAVGNATSRDFPLLPGAAIDIKIDDLSKIYIEASVASQSVVAFGS